MKFSSALIALAALLSSSEACKCLSPIGVNGPATRSCCTNVGGKPDIDECPAGQISSKLSAFALCCRQYGTRSDCRCPFGCGRSELAAQRRLEGKPAPTDDEVMAYVASYEEEEKEKEKEISQAG
jgi:hypothetical protein